MHRLKGNELSLQLDFLTILCPMSLCASNGQEHGKLILVSLLLCCAQAGSGTRTQPIPIQRQSPDEHDDAGNENPTLKPSDSFLLLLTDFLVLAELLFRNIVFRIVRKGNQGVGLSHDLMHDT